MVLERLTSGTCGSLGTPVAWEQDRDITLQTVVRGSAQWAEGQHMIFV